MDRSERFHRIDRLLRQRGRVTIPGLCEVLEVSRATIVRDIQYLRDRFGAPIVWDPDRQTYLYEDAGHFALPGLWLSAGELEALLTLDHLLARLQPDLIGKQLHPLRQRLQRLVEDRLPDGADLSRRLRLVDSASAREEPALFPEFAQATLERRRLWILHKNRERDETIEREISPQRLVRYRDNWYCDAWCHLRNGLRSFALDAVETARVLDRAAADIPDDKLDAKLGAGYGIFGGRAKTIAHLRFTAHAARWVSREHWHPEQRGQFLMDGRYDLCLPYTDPRELLMDLMRHGPEVEVLGPPALRMALIQRLDAARRQYPDAHLTGSSPEPATLQTPPGKLDPSGEET